MGVVSARCFLISTAVMAVLTVIFLLIGIVLPIYLDNSLEQGINDHVIVTSKSSSSYKHWHTNTLPDSAPLFMKFYLWNITNPDEIIQGANPIVEEFGPYAYREYNTFFNVSWNGDETEVSFSKWQYFIFSPEDSFPGADPHNDYYTTLNIPLMSALGGLTFNQTYDSLWWKTLLYDFLASYTNQDLFVNATANDILWGLNNTMLALLNSKNPATPATYYIQLNETDMNQAYMADSVNIAKTGKNDLTDIGSYVLWHNQTSVSCWGSTYANTVQGNDATQFRPGIKKGDLPKIWVEQLYRMVEIKGTGDAWVKGIYLLEFTLPPEGYLNATEYPANAAYYQFWQPGVGNMTACQKGAPVFMSKPHFLDAPYFAAQVTGVNPNEELHDTYVYVEPTIGQCFKAYKRLQLNIRLSADPLLYPQLNNDYLVPVVWVQEGGEITDQLAEEFKGSIYRIQNLSKGSKYVGLGLAVLCGLITTALAVKTYQLYQRRYSGYKPIINHDRD